MTTDSERRVHDLLEAAAPEPPHGIDGSAIRARVLDERLDDASPGTSRRWWTAGSVVLAAAAIVVVALLAAGIGGHGRATHRVAPAASTSDQRFGPRACSNSALVIQDGPTTDSARSAVAKIVVSNGTKRACALTPMPSIALTFDGIHQSTLRPAQYAPARTTIVRPDRPVTIAARLRKTAVCNGTGAGKTQLGLSMRGFTYSFDLPINGCGWTIESATVSGG